jgi:hypothetical protein
MMMSDIIGAPKPALVGLNGKTLKSAPAEPEVPVEDRAKQLPDPSGYRILCGIPDVEDQTEGGIFKPYGVRPFVVPEESFPAQKYPRGIPGQDHYFDWVDAILQGRKSCADFSHGGPLTEAVLVGAFTDRFPGQWLEWDRAACAFAGHAGANALVKRSYRDGWRVPGLG